MAPFDSTRQDGVPAEPRSGPSTSARALVFGAVAALCVSLLGIPVHLQLGSTLGLAGDIVAIVGTAWALWDYRQRRSTRRLANIVFPVVVGALFIVDISWGGYGPTALVWPTVTVLASIWVGWRALKWLTAAVLAFIALEAGLMLGGVLQPSDGVDPVWVISMWIELTAVTAVSGALGAWVYHQLRRDVASAEQRSEDYSATVGELGVGVFELDVDTRDCEVSEAVRSLVGLGSRRLPAEQAVAWVEANLAPVDVARLRHALAEVERSGVSEELEVQLMNRFPAVWLRLKLRLVRREERRVIQAAVQDISDVRLRDERRTHFMATMSHELRTPLAGLIASAELLSDAPLEPEHRHYLATVLEAGDHIRGMFDELLDFTRIEAGVVEVTSEPVDPYLVVVGAVDLFGPRAAEAGIELSVWVDPRVPETITSDPVRLKQVIVNLVSNALKFTAAGEVRVRAVHEDDRVVISVTDTGSGIAPAYLDKVFDPYERGQHGGRGGPAGQGLGLAISRRIVERLGGTIGVASVVGEGSTFTVSLPAEGALTDWPRPLEGQCVFVGALSAGTRDVVTRCLTDAGGEVADAGLAHRCPPTIEIAASGEVDPNHTGPPSIALRRLTDTSPRYQHLPLPVSQRELIMVCGRMAEERRGRGRRGTVAPQVVLRVLLVEDDPINLMMTQLLIEREGHTVDTATDGVTAVEAATSSPYDVVLMDLGLPRLSGLEAIRRIHDAAPTHRQHLVAYTADARRAVYDEVAEAGADEVLFKPASVDDLRALLARVSDR